MQPEEPVCSQVRGCSFSQPEVICTLSPVTLSHMREEGLDSRSHGKRSGSRLPLAFPPLDTRSAKHLKRVVCSSRPSTPTEDRKCPCDADGCFLVKCQLYKVELGALIFPIRGEY